LGQYSESCRGLLDGHFLDESRDQYFPEPFRQFVNGLLEQYADLVVRHGRLWIFVGVCIGERYDLRTEAGTAGKEADVDRGSTTTNAPQRLVDYDSRDPGAKLRLAPKVIEAGESSDIGFLKHILGIGIVSHDATCGAVKSPVLLLNQRPNSLTVPLPRTVYEPMVLNGLFNSTGSDHFILSH
jgi:hypothetical protein